MAQLDSAEWPSHIHPPKKRPIESFEEVPLEVFSTMGFPGSAADRAICAAALAIVVQSQGLSSPHHLDCLLLAAHPDWCGIFLNPNEHRAFDVAKSSAPNSLFVVGNQSIQWKKCRDYLEQQRAIIVQHRDTHQAISPGPDLASVRTGLPSGVEEVVRFALKAIGRIEELRKNLTSAPQNQVETIRKLEQWHNLCQLTA
jgi:hypothetical protein